MNWLTDRRAAFAALEKEYEEFVSLCESLTPEEWESQSLCTEWKARDVVAHIVALDRDTVTGRIFLNLLPNRDLESSITEGVAKWRDRSTDDLVAALKTWGGRARAYFKVIGPLLWNVRFPSPMGPLRGRSLVGARVYDLWSHNRDIAVPIGKAAPDPDRTGPAIQWMLDALGAMVGPALEKAGFEGRTVGMEIAGPCAGSWTWKVGERDSVEGDSAGADTVIRTDSAEYVVAGSWRERPAEAVKAGKITTEGDPKLLEAFLAHWYIY